MVCCLHVVHFFNYTLLFETGSAKYQPQVSHLISSGEEESGAKVAAMKPVKQTVTYDSSTGKMYEELGSTGSGSGESHVVTIPRHHVIMSHYQAAWLQLGGRVHTSTTTSPPTRGCPRCTARGCRPRPSTWPPPTPAPATWARMTGECKGRL